MTRHRQLPAGRENSHAHVGAWTFGCGHERGLGKTNLACDLLHRPGAQAGGVRKDRELVAAEPAIGEHVVMEIPVAGNAHARMFILTFTVYVKRSPR